MIRVVWLVLVSLIGVLPLRAQSIQFPLDSIEVDGRTRVYALHVPEGLPSSARPPLMLVLHGYGGTGYGMRFETGFDNLANREGFLVAYPEAHESVDRIWALGCARCTPADTVGIDDFRFIDALIDRLARTHRVDRRRVYAVGYSLGGWFAYALACGRRERIAAIAAVGATMPRVIADQCKGTEPLSVALLLGTHDEAMPWNGFQRRQYEIMGADSTMARWRALNSCAAPPKASPLRDRNRDGLGAMLFVYGGCANGAEVRLYRLDGLGHVWPTGDVDATEEIGKFLRRFRRG